MSPGECEETRHHERRKADLDQGDPLAILADDAERGIAEVKDWRIIEIVPASYTPATADAVVFDAGRAMSRCRASSTRIIISTKR